MKKRIAMLLFALLLAGCTQQTTVNTATKQPVNGPGKNTAANQNNTTQNQTQEGVFEIATADDLYAFAEQYNAGKLDREIRVVLTNDIVVNDTAGWESWATDGTDTTSLRKWYPIRYFQGTFDGQGHSIRGLYCHLTEADKDTYYYASLVMQNEGTVCNLSVEESVFLGDHVSVGPIVGRNDGTVENCHSHVYARASSTIGGIVSLNDETGMISGCTASGTVATVTIGNSMSVGGICGHNLGSITDCRNIANMQGERGSKAGGICGHNFGTIDNCHNRGDLAFDCSDVGGIVSSNSSNLTYGILRNSSNTGSITTTGEYTQYAAGVTALNYGIVENCYNTGDINAAKSAAGLCGGNYGTISYCWNTGSITGVSKAFGLADFCHLNELFEVSMQNCFSTGNILVTGDETSNMYNEAAGCVGRVDAVVMNCYNTGNISAPKEAAGICLDIGTDGKLNCVYNLGSIDSEGEVYGLANDLNGGQALHCYNLGDLCGGRKAYALFRGGYAGLANYCYNAGAVSTKQQQWLTPFLERMTDCSIDNFAEEYHSDMTQASSYVGFDFDTVWEMGAADYPYPTLRNMPAITE